MFKRRLSLIIGSLIVSWIMAGIISGIVWATIAGEHVCMYGPFHCGPVDRYKEAILTSIFIWPFHLNASPSFQPHFFYAGVAGLISAVISLLLIKIFKKNSIVMPVEK